MSTDQSGEVIKSISPAFSFPQLFTVPGARSNLIAHDAPLEGLFMLYRYSGTHARACHVKAEGAFGGGLIGKGAEKFEALTTTGSADLFTCIGGDLEVYGNGYMEVVRNARNQIIGVMHLPANTMYRNINKRDYTQVEFSPTGEQKVFNFPAKNIIHFRYYCPSAYYYALPQWIAVDGMIELVHLAVEYNKKFFNNNTLPEHAIITKGGRELSPEQKRAVKEFFRKEFGGVNNSHKNLYIHLGEGQSIEFKALSSGLKDGDFLKMLDAIKDYLPMAHGVPPRLLGIITAGSLGGGSEVVGQLKIFEDYTLAPRRRRMRDMLRPILAELGIAWDSIQFPPHDITPPDVATVPDEQEAQSIEQALKLLKSM